MLELVDGLVMILRSVGVLAFYTFQVAINSFVGMEWRLLRPCIRQFW